MAILINAKYTSKQEKLLEKKKYSDKRVNLPGRHNDSKCECTKRTSKYMEQKLIDLKWKIKKSTIIVGNQCNLSYQEGKE